MVNHIDIRSIETKNENNIKFDLFIDNVQLDGKLGINRLTDLRFGCFDLDIFEVDKDKFPNYNRNIIEKAVNTYLGNDKPYNQFGTQRVVLYRCHCGCDYCGIISFIIDFDKDYVYWKDIRFELDEINTKEDVISISELKFDKQEYMKEFENFLKKYIADV